MYCFTSYKSGEVIVFPPPQPTQRLTQTRHSRAARHAGSCSPAFPAPASLPVSGCAEGWGRDYSSQRSGALPFSADQALAAGLFLSRLSAADWPLLLAAGSCRLGLAGDAAGCRASVRGSAPGAADGAGGRTGAGPAAAAGRGASTWPSPAAGAGRAPGEGFGAPWAPAAVVTPAAAEDEEVAAAAAGSGCWGQARLRAEAEEGKGSGPRAALCRRAPRTWAWQRAAAAAGRRSLGGVSPSPPLGAEVSGCGVGPASPSALREGARVPTVSD